MSAREVIDQIEALPARERAEVFEYVLKADATDNSWIPESFKQGMADARAGRLVDMETVLSGAKQPARLPDGV